MMTNDELAAAISATQQSINQTGTACPSHPLHVDHLKKLLGLQVARAMEAGWVCEECAGSGKINVYCDGVFKETIRCSSCLEHNPEGNANG